MMSNQKVGINNSISVIIPAYNAEKTIIAALESVKNQTIIPDFYEVIVVDDGSTDKTSEIVNNYLLENSDLNGRIIHQVNSGVSAARNAGIGAAKAKWISLLDSDDVFRLNKNEILLEFILNNEDVDFVGGNLTEERTRIPFIGELPDEKKIRPFELLLKWVPQTSTVMMKKSVFDTVGGYDEKMRYAEDGDLYLKISENFNYYVLQRQLANFGPETQKQMFGDHGLSGNLNGMLKGNLKILQHARERKSINSGQYILFVIWNFVKHARRVMITRLRKNKV